MGAPQAADSAQGSKRADTESTPGKHARGTSPKGLASAATQHRVAAQFPAAARQATLAKLQKKREPYASAKGDSGIKFNCALQTGISDYNLDTAMIECRHLALAFASAGEKRRDLMNRFSHADGVEDHFENNMDEWEGAFGEMICHAPAASKHLVGENQLGQYLAGMAQALDDGQGTNGPTEGNSLLISHDHVLAVQVERKSKNGVDYFSAKLYDPNNTANFKRVEAQRPDELDGLCLSSLLIKPQRMGEYRVQGRALAMVAVCLDPALQIPLHQAKCLPDRESDQPPSAQEMHMALFFGLASAVEGLARADAPQTLAQYQAVLEILEAKDGAGIPGLHKAIRLDYGDTVQAFGERVRSSGLSNQNKIRLLSAKSPTGDVPLAKAARAGATNAVAGYAQVVLHSGLPPAAQAELLAAKDSHGVPAMALALEQGRTDAVQALGAAFAAAPLPKHMLMELLLARNAQGQSAEDVAYAHPDPKLLKAYHEIVKNAPLSPTEQASLLMGRATPDEPARARHDRRGQ